MKFPSKSEDRIGRLTAMRAAVYSARRVVPQAAPAPREDKSRTGELERALGAACGRNAYGEYMVIRRWFDAPAECPAPLDAVRLLAPGAPPEAADPRNWLFLDTETTGLAGGTGTYAFLTGLAWWDSAGLQVEQFFLRDFDEEHSMLLALRERMAERPVLVTFNGKSFDWPLLETRYRMTRSLHPPAPAAHLDLLHPARQLWRLRLGSVRLSELERHVLGWDRGFDIRSDLIPGIYFDYLRGGPLAPLTDVVRHNQSDLRGLATLAVRMLDLLASPEGAHGHALDCYGLSRLLDRRGDRGRARVLYERALDGGLPADIDRAGRRELALLARRQRDYARAATLWEELLVAPACPEAESRRAFRPAHLATAFLSEDDAGLKPSATQPKARFADSMCFEAYEQLAIYYEHRAHNPQRAAALVRDALAELRRAARARRLDVFTAHRLTARFERRLQRLQRKESRALFVACSEKMLT